MANNRLYIVNTETKEYICIAKSFGGRWGLGNVDLLAEFIDDPDEDIDTPHFIIGSENDNAFYDKWLRHGKNVNETNKWNYHK